MSDPPLSDIDFKAQKFISGNFGSIYHFWLVFLLDSTLIANDLEWPIFDLWEAINLRRGPITF